MVEFMKEKFNAILLIFVFLSSTIKGRCRNFVFSILMLPVQAKSFKFLFVSWMYLQTETFYTLFHLEVQ